MAYQNEYPSVDPYRYNDNWLLETVDRIRREWEAKRPEWEDTLDELEKQISELKSYVDNYFNNLDLSQEVSDKLESMKESGELYALVREAVMPFNLFDHRKYKSVAIPLQYNQTVEYCVERMNLYRNLGVNSFSFSVRFLASDTQGSSITFPQQEGETLAALLNQLTPEETCTVRGMMNYSSGFQGGSNFVSQYNTAMAKLLDICDSHKSSILAIGCWNELYLLGDNVSYANGIVSYIHARGYKAFCSYNHEGWERGHAAARTFDIIGFNFYPYMGEDFKGLPYKKQISRLYNGRQNTGNGYWYIFANLMAELTEVCSIGKPVYISEIGCSHFVGGTNPTWKADFPDGTSIDYAEQAQYYDIIMNYIYKEGYNIELFNLWDGLGSFSVYGNDSAQAIIRRAWNG